MTAPEPYRVIFLDRALGDLDAAFDYILNESQSKEVAVAWLEGVIAAADSLEVFPHRCGYAREDGLLPQTLRQLIHDSYRLIYSVDDRTRIVRVYRVRHAAMRPATRRDLE